MQFGYAADQALHGEVVVRKLDFAGFERVMKAIAEPLRKAAVPVAEGADMAKV